MDLNRTAVKQISYEHISLIGSWEPIERCLKYSGLVSDFLVKSEEKSYFSRVIGYFVLFSGALLVFISIVSMGVQLVIGIWGQADVLKLFQYSALFFFYISCFWTVRIYLQRHQILQLFNEWKSIEQQLRCFNRSSMKSVIKLYHINYFASIILLPIGVAAWNFMEPNQLISLSYYPVLRQTFGVHCLCLASAANNYLFVTWFFSLSELLPTLFFFHAGCAIENLLLEWKIRQGNGMSIHQIWKRYETIHRLADRANEYFGTNIAAADLNQIITICVCSYSCIYYLKRDPSRCFPFLIAAICTVLHTILINRLMSHYYLSGQKLATLATGLLCEKWHSLHRDDFDVLLAFSSALRKENMAVCPLNMYSVKPKNLLSILTVVVTYVIVLIQTVN